MPLVFCELIENQCHLALWEITESHSYFFELLPLDESTADELDAIQHPQKQLEWLASRYLIEIVTKEAQIEHNGVAKDEFGKPFLENTNVEISLSHTTKYVAVALHANKPVGIDLEKPSSKLLNVAARYCTETELIHAGDNLQKLCVYWSGKEALYKLYGRKRLTFRENLQLEPFDLADNMVTGMIYLENTVTHYLLHLRWIEGYLLVLVF